MPVLPVTAPQYDTVNTVLNTARVRLNDAIESIGGDILTNTAPFTRTIVTIAWRKLQEFLANKGYSDVVGDEILIGCPVVGTVDPAINTWVNAEFYFDGTNYWQPPYGPVLPENFISPLKVWERPTAQNAAFGEPMEMWVDGFPSCQKSGWNHIWEWRQNKLFMPGSIYSMDLRLRYVAYLPDFIDTAETPWYSQPVPISRCLDSFAYYICSEMSAARGDTDAANFKTLAEESAGIIFNRDQRMRQRTNIRRQSRSGRERGGWGW